MAEIRELEPTQLKHRLDHGDKLTVLDVREPEELAIAAFPGALHIPMGDIPSRLTELDPDADWVVVCHHGMRSANVASLVDPYLPRGTRMEGGADAGLMMRGRFNWIFQFGLPPSFPPALRLAQAGCTRLATGQPRTARPGFRKPSNPSMDSPDLSRVNARGSTRHSPDRQASG